MADGAKTSQGWVPIPDPTTLTTEQLRREIERLRVELTDKLGMAQMLIERLVSSNRALYEEKFRGVDKTFEERQTQFDQLVQANKDMTAQAFASAKEAVAKSDIDTDKQLEQLRKSLATAAQNGDDKIADLKDRLTRIESREVGAAQANDTTKWGIGAAIAIAGLLISAAVLWQKPAAPLGPAYVAPPAYYQPQASPPPVAPQPIIPKP